MSITREYYRKNNILPTKEWREKRYRLHPASTGEADQQDIESIYQICELIDKDFNPDKIGSGDIVITKDDIDDNEDLLVDIITQEQINHIKNSHGSSYGIINVTHKDLSIGQAYFVDKSMKGRDRKEQENRELTVATAAMAEFTQKLYKRGILRRRDTWKDEKKCRAIRYVLEHIGWIECLDGNWEPGVSKRWAIGENYHLYSEFEKYVGPQNVDRIRNQGMASLENWDDMGNTA